MITGADSAGNVRPERSDQGKCVLTQRLRSDNTEASSSRLARRVDQTDVRKVTVRRFGRLHRSAKLKSLI